MASLTNGNEQPFALHLGPGTGYGIVVGLGAAFAVVMLSFTWLQKRYTRFDVSDAVEFATASRSLKPGLICAGIVSAWTWSATLLQSSTSVYQQGLAAAWWYGAGGTTQICFFAAVAAKVKQNANGATTFLQIARARYGTPCHLLFTFYTLVTAHVVAGSVVLGSSATFNSMTGINIYACNFLLPIGIAAYVIAGGLRATFICDFIHTVILFVVIYIFMFSTFATSDILGSPSRVYELLAAAAASDPVPGSTDGSYMTLKSNSGILFAGITITAGVAGVFCDQGYWQRAIASRPETTTKAYMLGGLSWFSIPWAFGTTMGLAARATQGLPQFPTYPAPLSPGQQSAGLVAPAAAVVLLGKGGAIAILLVTFMAATSAASAELIAVSSIVVYDIIGTYIRPLKAHQLVTASHITIAVFGIWFGAWGSILHRANIDLSWMFYNQGVVLTPASVPIGLTVCWSKMSHTSAFWGTICGLVCGMLGWMIGCWKIYGHIGADTLALQYSSICGAASGLVTSAAMTIALALIFPNTEGWEKSRRISKNSVGADQHTLMERAHVISQPPPETGEEIRPAVDKRDVVPSIHDVEPGAQDTKEDIIDDEPFGVNMTDEERAILNRVFKRSGWYSITLALIVLIIVPMPMFGAQYVFSKTFFTFWIAAAFIWAFAAGTFCIILPVWESRKEIGAMASLLLRKAL